MAEVSIICKRTVLSTKPAQQGTLIPLSPLDLIMERNNLRIVVYYNFVTKRRPGELTEKLRESLCEMLTFYPIVSGRLLRKPEGWTVKFNDAGLRMVEAKVSGCLDEWLKNVDREKELKLVHWEEMFHKAYFWSTFYVQITEFEGGGLAIGLSCTHLLADPICATHMIKAWADTTLKGDITTPPIFSPLTFKKQEYLKNADSPRCRSHLIDHYKSAMKNSAPIPHAKQATVTLQFTHKMVLSCIAMVGNSTSLIQEPNTPFEALAALFWTRISKIKGVENGLLDMSICLDMRKVLNLDKAVFGNFMVYNRIHGGGLIENQVSKAAPAAFVKDAISQVDYNEVMGLIEWLQRGNDKISPPCMDGSSLICANLENAELYSAIFEEDVGPICVSCYIGPAVGLGKIVVLPLPDGGGPYGRVVAVTLPEDEAEKLLEDALIKQIGPTLLMGLDKKLSQVEAG